MKDRLKAILSLMPATSSTIDGQGKIRSFTSFSDLADYLIANGVLVPPCKVGDTIYLPWEWKDTSGVAILTIERMSITEAGCSIRTDLWSDDEDYWLAYNCGVFKFDDIGKTVFLTRKEAEKALAERSAE